MSIASTDSHTLATAPMSRTSKVTIHYAVGNQRYLTISELSPSATTSVQTIKVEVLAPSGALLMPPVLVGNPQAPIDVAHAVAQAIVTLPGLTYGVNHKPYLWDGTRWCEADNWALGLSLAMTRLIGTQRHTGRSSNCFYNAMMDAWKEARHGDELGLAAFGNCRGVPVLDGVVALSAEGDLTIEPNDPKNGNLHALPVRSQDVFDAWMELDSGWPSSGLLQNFLLKSLDKDQALVLQRWFGLHLVLNHVDNPEKLLFMYGPGGNGKGVVIRLLRALITDAAVAPLTLQDLRIPSNLEKLSGAVSMIGAEGAMVTDYELLKTIVSMEPINVNPKYRDPYTLSPCCLVTQASNSVPSFSDESSGMERRTIALHMRWQPSAEERIEGLADHICTDEYPMLVAWALRGASDVLQRGTIEVPESVATHSKRVVRPVRAVDHFVGILEFGSFEVAAEELYAGFRLMCDKQKLPLTPKEKFFADLDQRLERDCREFVKRSKVLDVEPSFRIADSGRTQPIAPQLLAVSSCDAYFGLRISDEHFGPPIGHPIKPGRRGLPSFGQP